MNPLSAKVYLKMIQTCKYFFAKNPILVVERLLMFSDQDLRVEHLGNNNLVDISSVAHKFWIIRKFSNYFCDPVSNFVSFVIPRFYQCDAKFLLLQKQILTLNEFLFLSSNVEDITLNCTTIKNEDDTVIAFEEIVKVIPKVKHIIFHENVPHKITKNTMKELLKIPHFSKIDKICFYDITEDFDIETFYTYFKVQFYII
uniref:DUF38 domain-containing protein n=1 Tax=Panagrolaimus davidi TaxID=227884 RepID=A0A914QGE4_9BILA